MSENQSAFDPDSFLATTTTDANETDYVPIPEGEWVAVVTEIKARNPKGNAILDVIWQIDDDQIRAETGMDNPRVRQSIFLDVNEQGALMTGKNMNVQLGRLRDALGQNIPGQPWAPSMLEGQVAKVTTSQRVDGDKVYSDVKSVSRL